MLKAYACVPACGLRGKRREPRAARSSSRERASRHARATVYDPSDNLYPVDRLYCTKLRQQLRKKNSCTGLLIRNRQCVLSRWKRRDAERHPARRTQPCHPRLQQWSACHAHYNHHNHSSQHRRSWDPVSPDGRVTSAANKPLSLSHTTKMTRASQANHKPPHHRIRQEALVCKHSPAPRSSHRLRESPPCEGKLLG